MDNGQLRNPFGMILKRQNMSENQWNHFKIVPQGHNNCQLSIVNCQFGEAAKFQFIEPQNDTGRVRKNDHTYLARCLSAGAAGRENCLLCIGASFAII